MPANQQRSVSITGITQRGKCSIGWFFGFKLHIICNEMGEIVNFMFTPGNVDDRDPLKVERFTEELYRKIIADRGYISKDLFCKLFFNGILLITKLKKQHEELADECRRQGVAAQARHH